jgi:tetrahydromethanopterin S-methyltransferase subunit G
MSDDPARERARVSEEARRKAREEGERARLRAESEAARTAADVLTGELGEEAVRQLGVIYGGLIGIAVVMIQPFLAARSIDVSARVSVIAFSVAIPLLAALVMVNRQEVFRHRRTPSVSVTIAQVVAQGAAFVGIVAGFWHIDWIAGVAFLAVGFVAMLVHSAGYTRLEMNRPSQEVQP